MGCRPTPNEPAAPPGTKSATLYTSVDEPFARLVIDRFCARTGIEVALITDSEAGKTTGLVQRIRTEADTGRVCADVFWSGEIFNTILLARQGLLAAYDSPAAADIPDRFRDPQHRWTGMALRARVLAYDPRRTAAADLPTKWEQLADPSFAKELALANPLFGTTRGQVAAMLALWGPERGTAFLRALREGRTLIVDGNSAAVRALMAGQVRYAATDSDDVYLARKSGASLSMILPEMGDGAALLIPGSVALLKDAPHSAAARELVDFLVSAEVEEMLARSESGNIPVRPALRETLNIRCPASSSIAYETIADQMESAVLAAREILLR